MLPTLYRLRCLATLPSRNPTYLPDTTQVNGLGVEEAVAVVREARPHILLQEKHFEALRNFHSQLHGPQVDK